MNSAILKSLYTPPSSADVQSSSTIVIRKERVLVSARTLEHVDVLSRELGFAVAKSNQQVPV